MTALCIVTVHPSEHAGLEHIGAQYWDSCRSCPIPSLAETRGRAPRALQEPVSDNLFYPYDKCPCTET